MGMLTKTIFIIFVLVCCIFAFFMYDGTTRFDELMNTLEERTIIMRSYCDIGETFECSNMVSDNNIRCQTNFRCINFEKQTKNCFRWDFDFDKAYEVECD